ncbi:MAG: CDP-diacylglycerol--serine O-phosphatidyltransferase [Elusimicrobia bacterium GWA2_69_24]|nr:MAG: CDP-diacylglycerol--serine O-phosphatidyltransferase [Elusimicrobia bacterium GWA2_69_24]HBL18867.1 CDP-diacylglycerol--serine O-phosphatidyltransferase [Elusimicrobiota bacterium]
MDRHKIKRSSQVLAPSIFTMGNMACGFYSLMAVSIGDFRVGATCILGGIIFDMLDGRVARLVRGESSFGVEFDSLSDFLTFGVAPAYMMCDLLLKDYGPVGFITAFIYALCGALRLARFNAVAHSGAGSKTHFQGLPIPAAAGFLASFVLLYTLEEEGLSGQTLGWVMSQIPRVAGLGLFLVLGLSFLMVSSIPYGAFKQKEVFRPRNVKLLAGVGVTMTLLYFYPQNAVFLIFLFYVVSGLMGLLRRPKETPPPVSPDIPGEP